MAEHVHLMGIGGTGMTALAGLLHESGCRVTGSDRRLYPPTSTILAELGLDVRSGFDPAHLSPRPDLVVVGNAISRGNPEVEELLDRDLPYTSMPRLIAERFLNGRHSIVVAGTHGKTTTASMLAWVLTHAGLDPGFLIGGQPQNFPRPFHLGEGPAFVIEGDEYDSAFFDKGPKFMHYRPDTALLGTVEYDHADIYPDLEHVEIAFRRLVNLIPRRGLVVRHEDCTTTRRVSDGALSRVEGYGADAGRWRAHDLQDADGGTSFDVRRDGEPFASMHLTQGGGYNVMNALSVVAAAAEQGVAADTIAAGLAGFTGVRRRLELRGEADGVQVFDDFAHHPTAIAAVLNAVSRREPSGRVWAVIEPRSWSLRRNVFQARLAEAFRDADEVLIAPVFAAEQIAADERLDPRQLAAELGRDGGSARAFEDVDSIVDLLAGSTEPGDRVVVMSNGAFEGLHERLLDALASRARTKTSS